MFATTQLSGGSKAEGNFNLDGNFFNKPESQFSKKPVGQTFEIPVTLSQPEPTPVPALQATSAFTTIPANFFATQSSAAGLGGQSQTGFESQPTIGFGIQPSAFGTGFGIQPSPAFDNQPTLSLGTQPQANVFGTQSQANVFGTQSQANVFGTQSNVLGAHTENPKSISGLTDININDFNTIQQLFQSNSFGLPANLPPVQPPSADDSHLSMNSLQGLFQTTNFGSQAGLGQTNSFNQSGSFNQPTNFNQPVSFNQPTTPPTGNDFGVSFGTNSGGAKPQVSGDLDFFGNTNSAGRFATISGPVSASNLGSNNLASNFGTMQFGESGGLDFFSKSKVP
ncbi:unnamed protein product [Sphagnum balticum]